MGPDIQGMLKIRGGRLLKAFVVAAIPAHNEEETIARFVLECARK